MLQSDDVTCSGVKHLTSRVMTPEPHEREQSDHLVMNHSLTQASRAHACVTSGRFASAQFASSTMTTARPTCLTQMTSRDLTPLPHVTEHCKENEAMTKTFGCQAASKKLTSFQGPANQWPPHGTSLLQVRVSSGFVRLLQLPEAQTTEREWTPAPHALEHWSEKKIHACSLSERFEKEVASCHPPPKSTHS